MTELASAAAWLESLGYAHGDIRPPSILLDGEDHLKLIDFDNTAAVGTDMRTCVPPYVRLQGDEAGEHRGDVGRVDPRTEQFAVGSVYYYMSRDYEPYGNEWFGDGHGPDVVERLQK